MLLRILVVLCLIASACCNNTAQVKPKVVSVADPPTKVVPLDGKIQFFALMGAVTGDSVRALADDMSNALPRQPQAIVIEINSPGGDQDAAFALTKLIEAYPLPVVCIVDGEAASAAFYILQACPARAMTDRSTLMAHEPYFEVKDAFLTRAFLKQMVEEQDKFAFAWTAFAGKRLKMPLSDFRAKLREGDWTMTAPEALKVGAVDTVISSTSAE